MSGEKFTTTTLDITTSEFRALYDESCHMWENDACHNLARLEMQQAYFNDRLRRLGRVRLREVFDVLGIDRTPVSSVSGWGRGYGGGNRIDFGLGEYEHVENQEPSIVLNFNAHLLSKRTEMNDDLREVVRIVCKDKKMATRVTSIIARSGCMTIDDFKNKPMAEFAEQRGCGSLSMSVIADIKESLEVNLSEYRREIECVDIDKKRKRYDSLLREIASLEATFGFTPTS